MLYFYKRFIKICINIKYWQFSREKKNKKKIILLNYKKKQTYIIKINLKKSCNFNMKI